MHTCYHLDTFVSVSVYRSSLMSLYRILYLFPCICTDSFTHTGTKYTPWINGIHSNFDGGGGILSITCFTRATSQPCWKGHVSAKSLSGYIVLHQCIYNVRLSLIICPLKALSISLLQVMLWHLQIIADDGWEYQIVTCNILWQKASGTAVENAI